eukprot:s837_g30.t1
MIDQFYSVPNDANPVPHFRSSKCRQQFQAGMDAVLDALQSGSQIRAKEPPQKKPCLDLPPAAKPKAAAEKAPVLLPNADWSNPGGGTPSAADFFDVPPSIVKIFPSFVRTLLRCDNGHSLTVVRNLDVLFFCAGRARVARWAELLGLKTAALDREFGLHLIFAQTKVWQIPFAPSSVSKRKG